MPKTRCTWSESNPLMMEYHDQEWGVPLHDDQKLFEFIILEGAQAGLSWQTILQRREGYRQAFANFDAKKIVRFTPEKLEKLMENVGIIRNRLKIKSVVQNARAFLAVQKEFGSFDRYIWGFVEGKPRNNRLTLGGEYPTRSTESDAMAKDLKRRGFNFVGTTICYAFMQAVGMVNDHVIDCFRYKEV